MSALTRVGAITFFRAYTPTTGTELWKTDGTPLGTVLVKDINPGSDGSFPDNLLDFNGTLFFTASSPATGYELWRSDGSPQGTTLVKDTHPGPESSSIGELTTVQGRLFFRDDCCAINGANSLWVSDGTTAGTISVKNILAMSLVPFNQLLFFSGYDAGTGLELWKSDGTPQGTVLVKDIHVGPEGSNPQSLISLNGTLILTAYDDATGTELWRSDGTAQGTQLIKDINPGQNSGLGPFALAICSPFTIKPISFKGKIFFAADDGVHGYELWESDGTSQGTILVKDINPGEYGSTPYEFVAINDQLFFIASDGLHEYELWRSDGTANGTSLFKDINPHGSSVVYYIWSSPPSVLCPYFVYFTPILGIDNRLVFSAEDGEHGRELWTSDGTPEGTALVQDFVPGSGSGTPTELTPLGKQIVFRAQDTDSTVRLWSMIFNPHQYFLPAVHR